MKIKQISNNINSYDATCLKLEISGKNVCYQTLNSIRRVCSNQIPIYAFHPDKISITRNNSVYDNSELTDRFSQLPITKFNHQIKFLPQKYYKDVNFSEQVIERHPEDIYQINYSFKKKNNGPETILYVSTNDLIISITSTVNDKNKLISDKIIPPKEKFSEKYPIVLVKLRPGEEIECSMKGVLAIGEYNGIFNASTTYYEQLAEDKFILKIESCGQLSEYQILIRSCEIIIEKLKLIKENLLNNQYNLIQTANNALIVEILNEDHTCANPITWVLQNMEEIKFAGLNKPDYMQKKINIVIQCNSDFKILNLLDKAIDKTIEIFNEYKNEFEKLY